MHAEFNRSKIRALVPEDDADAVLDVLSAYFHELEEIYSFFSTLDNGPINSMSSMEFNEFVRHCGILDGEDRAAIKDDAVGGGDDLDVWRVVTQGEGRIDDVLGRVSYLSPRVSRTAEAARTGRRDARG